MGRVFRFMQPVICCIGTLLMLTGILQAQDARPIPAPSTPYVGIPEDWTAHHVIYTRNGSDEDMLKVRDDPRFLNNVLLHYMRERRSQDQPPASAGLNESGEEENSLSEDGYDTDKQDLQPLSLWERLKPRPTPPPRNKHSKVDWAVSLGGSGQSNVMGVGESPAKYTFSTSGTPSCSDFIVYVVGANNVAAGTQADLVGLTNLYSGSSPTGFCGAAPTFLFSYAIAAAGKHFGSLLSPELSLDGTKVAWIEGGGTNAAILHVTKWVAGQGTNATTGSVAIGSGSSDVALAYTQSAIAGCSATPHTDSDSDLYVDYRTDTAFLSADNGILYHIKGIFLGTPAVDFCITVNATAGSFMGGTVYDSLLNEVFISDSSTVYAYTVGAASFTLAASRKYAASAQSFAASAPVLDAFNGFIYMFTTDDNEAPAHTSVAQLPTSLASVVYVPLGPVGTTPSVELNYGAFDNNYYNFGPANAASTLYSCGTDSTTNSAQDLFAIKFIPATGVVDTTPAMAANTHVNPGGHAGICSPITEFFDGTTDRIFVGMGNYNGATTGANTAQMWDVTTRLTSTADTPTAQATGYQGGTSGFTVDNNASPAGFPQAESVYFFNINVSGTSATCGAGLYCAVKLTQSLLH